MGSVTFYCGGTLRKEMIKAVIIKAQTNQNAVMENLSSIMCDKRSVKGDVPKTTASHKGPCNFKQRIKEYWRVSA